MNKSKTNKICTSIPTVKGCGESKSLKEFYQDKHGHIKNTCKKCTSKANKEKIIIQKEKEVIIQELLARDHPEVLTEENLQRKNRENESIIYLTEKLRILEIKIEESDLRESEAETYIKELEETIRVQAIRLEECEINIRTLEEKNVKMKNKLKLRKEEKKLK